MLYSSSTCNKRNSNQSIQMKWSNLHTYKFHYTRMQLSLREKNGNCEKLCNLKLKITNAIRIVFEFYLNEQRCYHGCIRSPPHLLCIRFAFGSIVRAVFFGEFFSSSNWPDIVTQVQMGLWGFSGQPNRLHSEMLRLFGSIQINPQLKASPKKTYV